MIAAPYYWLGGGDPPNVTTVLDATGVEQITLAFVLCGAGGTPMWDGVHPLTGGIAEAVIGAVRANGGDVTVCVGGDGGRKLGPNHGSEIALAAAYQQIVDAYDLRYLDIDIENSDEFQDAVVQDRILGALRIVKQSNPGLTTIVTFPTSPAGPGPWGTRLIERAATLGADIDVFTIMPFEFEVGAGTTGDMYADTVDAAGGLRDRLMAAFGWSGAEACAHLGISGMNGRSGRGELTTTAIWTRIRDWADEHHIARLAFWSINRDRACPGGESGDNCSGIAQPDWAFTRITAGSAG